MTNQEAADHLKRVAEFLESEAGATTQLYAHVKLTTPLGPDRDGVYDFMPHRNNISELTLSTNPERFKS